MPELAEVEFYRRKWNAGIGARITRVQLHAQKRIFRGIETARLAEVLKGATLVGSAAHGKQMLFEFSRKAWVGIHLGMTGELRVEPSGHQPAKHDHLVLHQKEQALVFSDPRLFGRVLFDEGAAPEWWRQLPPAILSDEFTLKLLAERLAKHRTLPLKAALLDQATFPGIGNWLADEILWQMRMHPRTGAGDLNEKQVRELWRVTRRVVQESIDTVAGDVTRRDFGDPPAGYLFHVRWKRGGLCPRDQTVLKHETIGGRTTAWCPKCQGGGR